MGTVTIKKQSAASVSVPATDQFRLFVDSGDNILKTKDSANNVTPSGVGTATALDTTGASVDVSASPPPATDYALEADSAVSAVWRPRTLPYVQTAVQAGAPYLAALNDLVRVDCSAAARTINLPTAVGHTREIMVKLVTVATFACTIDAFAAETIDGALTLVFAANPINDFAWAILKSDGANWMQVG